MDKEKDKIDNKLLTGNSNIKKAAFVDVHAKVAQHEIYNGALNAIVFRKPKIKLANVDREFDDIDDLAKFINDLIKENEILKSNFEIFKNS